MRGLLGVFVGACCALAIACAAGGHRSAAPQSASPMSPAPGEMGAQDPRSQIEQLDRQIADARTKLGMTDELTPAPVPHVATSEPLPMATTDPACHPGVGDTCTSTCTLADSICGNATKICDLAKQMPGDTWAADHCTSATTTCQAAHVRCCGCQ